jgi:hypothetical protein
MSDVFAAQEQKLYDAVRHDSLEYNSAWEFKPARTFRIKNSKHPGKSLPGR